ncbi:MAG: RNA polymerase sigma factor, partial [Chloroflexota bacterium]
RSSLRTWIFRILTNCAKSRAVREGRSIPFSSAWSSEDNVDDPAVDPSRFRASDPWRDHWTSLPQNWDALPEDRLLARDTLACVRQAMDALPAGQRTVIALRDVEGWSADEVCNVLNISETNQRVLLHRARSKVRRALETYFDLGERA